MEPRIYSRPTSQNKELMHGERKKNSKWMNEMRRDAVD